METAGRWRLPRHDVPTFSPSTPSATASVRGAPQRARGWRARRCREAARAGVRAGGPAAPQSLGDRTEDPPRLRSAERYLRLSRHAAWLALVACRRSRVGALPQITLTRPPERRYRARAAPRLRVVGQRREPSCGASGRASLSARCVAGTDCHVRHRYLEFAAQTVKLITLLPGRLVTGLRDDDHFIRAEVAQLIFESNRGIGSPTSPRAAIPCSRAQVNERWSRVRASASSPSMSDIA